MVASAKVNGNISFWYTDMGGVPSYRGALPGDTTADVCIVGAGYTGLWTAYYLRKADPSIKIIIVEKEFAGFGASGRNGGWCSGGFSWSKEKYLKSANRAAVIAMERAMAAAVDEVCTVAELEGIDADIVRTEHLMVATSPAQLGRLTARYRDALDWEAPQEKVALLAASQAAERIAVRNVHGAMLTRGVARLQPAKLVRGLAATVERLGVSIFEKTEVTNIKKGQVTTRRGTVRSPVIIRATEGFTAGLPGHKRLWLPLNSAQIVTEPLPETLWKQIGWQGRELLGDISHAYCYAQRTREGRIAMGGRGVPYRFGSATDEGGRTQNQTIAQLRTILHRLLPQTTHLKIDHAWCGVLGVPRDWCTTAGLDRSSGIGWAGGYVGNGVSSSNLSGRTLRDLILNRDTDLTRLPWVNRTVRKWEPEPFRWLGVHSMYQLYRMADEREEAGLPRTSRLAAFADGLTGK
ncbi:glycine/D-amino acid oxidase-like deaminating enzyme [Mesorhizobium sp. YL-MeA3-2017]|uniref:NAD(P)/FAD-dependent oxidoreductase n=1 Tax=Mesorhizobium sp. YL-MeA3-2017 TaxID=3042284 RepID=UPI0015C96779|nr:FAD-binding oxidoreductase [Mesorhizobium sp. YL-MeA3-2017]MDQ0333021.1 glycine/D-amino acid oxidase-like deaminating enzyme [Mesorhizobium sp. YL-MeA3-2017]